MNNISDLNWGEIINSIKPYPWTLMVNHPLELIKNNHMIMIEFKRYKLIIETFFKYAQHKNNINILGEMFQINLLF